MSELARRYAAALSGTGCEENALLESASFLKASAPLWSALNNPCVKVKEKHALLDRVLQETGAPLLHFYKLLCDNDRVPLLDGIVAEYHILTLQKQNAADAYVRCAYPLTQEQQDQIKAVLCQKCRKTRVDLHMREDPSLLGGFVVEIEGAAYDSSIKGLLRGMQRRLQAR